MQLLKLLNSMMFTIFALGVAFLFSVDFLYSLISSGHANPDTEKFLRDTIGVIIGLHYSKQPRSQK